MPKIIVQALLLCCLAALAAPAWGQPAGPTPPGSFSPRTMEEARLLCARQQTSPASAPEVRERQARLDRVLAELFSAGHQRLGQKVMDRGERALIEENLRAGRPELAALLVDQAVDRLAWALWPREAREAAARPRAADLTRLPLSRPERRVRLNRLRLGQEAEPVLKLMNPAIDPLRRKLYVSGIRSTHLAVVDLERMALERSVDMGVTGGFLLVEPGASHAYLFKIPQERVFRVDLERGGAQEVPRLPPGLAMPPRGAWQQYKDRFYKDFGFPFQPGYLQERNASYGVIAVRDQQGRVLGSIMHGPDGLYFGIDQAVGRLWAVNTGDASLSVFDLERGDRWLRDVPTGTSVEGMAPHPDGQSLYVLNRLGGNQILRHDLATGRLAIIPNENQAGPEGIGLWPSGMALLEGRLFVLSHFAGRVDVIDTQTDRLLPAIELGLAAKPRTDGLSAMVADERNGLLFAAFPELSAIAVADARQGRGLGVIHIEGFPPEVHGPHSVLLGVDGQRGKLFAYLARQRQLNLYDCRSLALERSLPMDAGVSPLPALLVDEGAGRLYLGSKVLDTASLAQVDALAPGLRAVGLDQAGGRLYLARTTRLTGELVHDELFEHRAGALERSWTFSAVPGIPCHFTFDFARDRFFVGYMETAVVEEFSLAR